MLLFENAQFDYEPFPVALIKPAFDENVYIDLVRSFPPLEYFACNESYGGKRALKYSLSEINNPDKYHSFIRSVQQWTRFYDWVKSPEFVEICLNFLLTHKIDLGFRIPKRSFWGRKMPLRPRFEFSSLPANGDGFNPHTDSPTKRVTFVISMIEQWDTLNGGATEMLRAKTPSDSFNWMNRYLDFDNVEVIRSVTFTPNQALVFIKTFNSLHAVRPLSGHAIQPLRQTITLVLEAEPGRIQGLPN